MSLASVAFTRRTRDNRLTDSVDPTKKLEARASLTGHVDPTWKMGERARNPTPSDLALLWILHRT